MLTNNIEKALRKPAIADLLTLVETNITESDFKKLDSIVHDLGKAYKSGNLTKEDIELMYRAFGEEFLLNTLQGHCLRKPRGYAGDYLLIDKLYTNYESSDERYRMWDRYSHYHHSANAVRNRKRYFKAKIKHKISKSSELKVLNIASGPARDVLELFEEVKSFSGLSVTCIDLDKDAIAYAQNLTKEYSDNIEFIHGNALRFRTEQKYDVVWSAGLFDYFNDKAFVLMLSRMKNFVAKGGEIIVGNFNENNNPSRDYMEIFGEWFLIHRTEEELATLAMQAGFSFSQINIGREPENVNLFLHISC